MLELRGCWYSLKILLGGGATLWGAGSLLLLGLDLHLGLDFQEYKCLGSVFIYKNEVISPSKVVLTREHDFLGTGNLKLGNLGQLSFGRVSHSAFPLLNQTKMQALALSGFTKSTKASFGLDSNSNANASFRANANFNANSSFNSNSNSNLPLETSFYPCFKSGVYSLELNDKWGPFKAHDMLVKEVVASGVCVELITPKFLGWIKVSNYSGALKDIEGDIEGDTKGDAYVEGDAAASSIIADAKNSTQNGSEKTVAKTALSSGAVPNIGSKFKMEFGTELGSEVYLGLNRRFSWSFDWGYEVTLLKTPSIYVANDLLILSRVRESWFCLGASTRNASILKDALVRDAIFSNVNEKAKSKSTPGSNFALNPRFKAKQLTFIKCQKSTLNQVSNTHNYAPIKVWKWHLVRALEQVLAQASVQGQGQIFDSTSVLTQALASTLSSPPVLSSDFRWREIYVVPKSILMDANLTYRINLKPGELFIMGGTKEALDSRILGGLPNTKTKLREVKWYFGQRPKFTSANKHLFWDRRFYSDLY